MKSKALKINEIIMYVIFAILLFSFICFMIIFKYKGTSHKIYNNGISSYEIVDYIDDKIAILVEPKLHASKCAVSTSESKYDLVYQEIIDGKCGILINHEPYYVFFMNEIGMVSDGELLSDYVYKVDIDKKYYIPLNSSIDTSSKIYKVGEPIINFTNTNPELVTVDENGLVNGIGNGMSIVSLVINGEVYNDYEIYVSDKIVNMPTSFDYKKSYLSCGQFSEEEAKLEDEILAYRVSQAGEGTRAGAVAAARFLTLEFPYRINYYWENGRLHPSGSNYVDGEGRYYHKGLYLDKSKYEGIVAKLLGPQMWGCKMTNLEEDEPFFIRGVKYPNGLDCSGFVSWSLVNGGFDPGDRGAGDSAYKYEMTDLGDYQYLTYSLINSGRIKVGDLINFSGHIGMIIGIDDNNIYVAESLNTLGGVVAKTYSKSSITKTFNHVVLMDEFYKEDGNLTDMWY